MPQGVTTLKQGKSMLRGFTTRGETPCGRYLQCIRGSALGFAQAAWADTEITFYYPIAVGGPLTKVIDGYAAEFEKQNPGVKVKPIYAGNYDDARIKALAALKAGQPAQISVLFSIDIYELLEQDVIVPWDDVATTARGQGLAQVLLPGADDERHLQGQGLRHPVPALDDRHVLEQGRVQGSRPRPGEGPGQLERDDADGAASW